jgi:hypothetical protein
MLKAKDLKPDSPCYPSYVYGVDFSGAKKAGSKIWITSAPIMRDLLKIEDCFQAKDLPSSSAERDQCLGALWNFIRAQKTCAFGLDFPFGLPSVFVEINSWEEFVLSFGERYPDPKEFRDTCWVAAGNRELRRDTDRNSQTPFSPYNRRLYRQTYYGIRDVLAPLVRNRLACVLPMQRVAPGKPWLFEVCPASTLKSINLYLLPYKRADKESRLNRARIIEGVVETGAILIDSLALRSKIIDDRNGDALDSVIAAFATFRALRHLAHSSVPSANPYLLEGYVYV